MNTGTSPMFQRGLPCYLTLLTMNKIFTSLILLLIGCNASNNNQQNSSDTILVAKTTLEDTVNFCTACDSLDSWKGSIQGVQVSDSTGVYPMAECHTNKSYDLIWTPKEGIFKLISTIGSASLITFFDNEEKNNFKNFDCYAFVIPKTKKVIKEYQEGDDGNWDYVFPCQVKIYKKQNLGWTLLKTTNIKSFEELGRLKLNCIFQKD
jgi:hypothetical protein